MPRDTSLRPPAPAARAARCSRIDHRAGKSSLCARAINHRARAHRNACMHVRSGEASLRSRLSQYLDSALCFLRPIVICRECARARGDVHCGGCGALKNCGGGSCGFVCESLCVWVGLCGFAICYLFSVCESYSIQ